MIAAALVALALVAADDAPARPVVVLPGPIVGLEFGDGWATFRWKSAPAPAPAPIPPAPPPVPPTPPPTPVPDGTPGFAAIVLPAEPTAFQAALRRNAVVEKVAAERKLRVRVYLEGEEDVARLGLDRHVGAGAGRLAPPAAVIYTPARVLAKGPVPDAGELVALIRRARGQ
jgi:hypothetical protein